MTPDGYDKIIAALRKLVSLIDAIFLYGGQAALGIAFGAAILLVIVHFTGLGSWQLEHSAAWVFMGASGAATGCGIVLVIQRLIGQR